MTKIKSIIKKIILPFREARDEEKGFRLGYIDARETIRLSRQEKISVCDYLEREWGQQGDTQKIIEKISAYNFLVDGVKILEIGSGSGRYLEKTLEIVKVGRYESYEPAKDWADYLQEKYPIVSRNSDGLSLKDTPDESIDYLHAHGVFVYLPFLVSWRYFKEIWRVLKQGGGVVFDIYSEDCMTESAVNVWLESGNKYPCFLSKPYVTSVFESHGFSLIDAFRHPHGSGESEYLVFKRHSL